MSVNSSLVSAGAGMSAYNTIQRNREEEEKKQRFQAINGQLEANSSAKKLIVVKTEVKKEVAVRLDADGVIIDVSFLVDGVKKHSVSSSQETTKMVVPGLIFNTTVVITKMEGMTFLYSTWFFGTSLALHTSDGTTHTQIEIHVY